MSPKKPIDIDKIKQLIATATTAKQKQMYQKLLAEAELSLQEQQQELSSEQENTAPETVEKVGKIKDDAQDKTDNSNTLVKTKKGTLPTRLISEEDNSQKKLIEKEKDSDILSSDSEDKEEEDSNKYTTAFQAVGVVQGKATFNEEEKLSLELGGKNYDLFPGIGRFWAKKGLQKQIALTGKDDYPLMVYPKITHYPQKHQPHNIYFQLVAFDAGNHPELQQTTFTELNEG